MRRTPWVLVAVISAAAVLSGCGDSVGPAAAKVGSTTISRATFDDELQALIDNKAFVNTLAEEGFDLNPTNGGINSRASAAWMTTLINQALVDQELARRNTKVSEKNRSDARVSAFGFVGSAEAFDGFPRAFRKILIARQARNLALRQAVEASQPEPPPPTQERLEELFQTSQQQCPTGRVISHIVAATEADANAILAQLAQGGDFATIAEQESLDTGSGAGGGLLACFDSEPYRALDPAVRATAEAASLGVVSAPVKTVAGYEIVKMSPWDIETARPLLLSGYEAQALRTVFDDYMNRKLRRAQIWVDPRYGRLDLSGTAASVAPPAPPELRTDPVEPTTTTTAFSATGQ